jgi:hypothetical protein
MQPDIVYTNPKGDYRILARAYNPTNVEIVCQERDDTDGWLDDTSISVDVTEAVALVSYLQGFIESRPVCVSHATEWNVFDGVLWVGGIPAVIFNEVQHAPEWATLVSLMLTGNVTRNLFNNYAMQLNDTANEAHILALIAQYKEVNEF